MREAFFHRLLSYPSLCTQPFVQKIVLQVLMHTTARAFHTRGMNLFFASSDKALKTYAMFTRKCMEELDCNHEHLYACAYALGQQVRRITGLRKHEDIQNLIFLLYRNIGISMDGLLPGTIFVRKCYFAQIYTPEQCALISAMDDGIIAGLFSSGSFSFSQRITEGCAHCTAFFEIN